MSEKLFYHEPDWAVPPGATMLEALEEAGLTEADLARSTGLSVEHVSWLAKGHKPITADVAVRLEHVLGIPSRFWEAREANYRERLVRLAERFATSEDSD